MKSFPSGPTGNQWGLTLRRESQKLLLMLLKRLLLICFMVTLSCGPGFALSIETAYTRYYDSRQIRPLLQYFGRSLTGQRFRTVVASQTSEPEGQYFIVRLKEKRTDPPVLARMTIYSTNTKDPWSHEWSLQGVKLENWLYLGLTGSDWPGEEAKPLAWRVEFLDANGQLVAEWESFLWEMP